MVKSKRLLVTTKTIRLSEIVLQLHLSLKKKKVLRKSFSKNLMKMSSRNSSFSIMKTARKKSESKRQNSRWTQKVLMLLSSLDKKSYQKKNICRVFTKVTIQILRMLYRMRVQSLDRKITLKLLTKSNCKNLSSIQEALTKDQSTTNLKVLLDD